MAQTHHEKCIDLCKHVQVTIGCPACRLVDRQADLALALSEMVNVMAEIKEHNDRIATKGSSKSVIAALDWAIQRRDGLENRIAGLKDVAEDDRAYVDKICQANGPDALARAFEAHVEAEMAHMQSVWDNVWPDSPLGQHRLGDAESPAPSTFLDRTRIPATPDSLVLDGQGLAATLFAGRSMRPQQHLPTDTVGEELEPARMSHGRALQMFGLPNDPGGDASPESDASEDEQVVVLVDHTARTSLEPPLVAEPAPTATEPPPPTATGPPPPTAAEPLPPTGHQQQYTPPTLGLISNELSLIEEMLRPSGNKAGAEPGPSTEAATEPAAEPTIEAATERTAEPAVEPVTEPAALLISEQTTDEDELTTEREYRDKHCSPTASILPAGANAWDLVLGSNRFARFLPLMCEHYIQLVRAKDDENPMVGSKGWPQPEGLDFNGFINWISRCKALDASFLKTTVKQWSEDHIKRSDDIDTKLKNVELSKEVFSDAGLLGLGSATQYYKSKQSLVLLDASRVGEGVVKSKR